MKTMLSMSSLKNWNSLERKKHGNLLINIDVNKSNRYRFCYALVHEYWSKVFELSILRLKDILIFIYTFSINISHH